MTQAVAKGVFSTLFNGYLVKDKRMENIKTQSTSVEQVRLPVAEQGNRFDDFRVDEVKLFKRYPTEARDAASLEVFLYGLLGL